MPFMLNFTQSQGLGMSATKQNALGLKATKHGVRAAKI